MRIIPRTAKVKLEFFKNVSVIDIVVGIVGLAIELVLLLSKIGTIKYFIMVFLLCLIIGLYLPYDGRRFYTFFADFTTYMFSAKKYFKQEIGTNTNILNLMPFKNVRDGYIEYEGYYAGVLEISAREFRLLTGFRQDQIINNHFGKLIRSINNKTKASLIKIDKKMCLDDYISAEEAKKEELKRVYEAGELTDNELFVRERIVDDRIAVYKKLNDENGKIMKPAYYLVVYDSQKAIIDEILGNGIADLKEAGMESKILTTKEILVFLKYNYTSDFDENDVELLTQEEYIDWIAPKEVQFGISSTIIDGVETFNFTVKNYPLTVQNAWGYQMFNIENTKVVMNLEPFEKDKAVRMIDRSLQELMSQSEQSYKASSVIDKSTHINTLVQLLRMLKNDNETLFKVNLHFTVYNRNKENKREITKRIMRVLNEQGFEISENFYKQNFANISINPSAHDAIPQHIRAIHSNSIAAVFPFVLSAIMEKGGVILGQSNDFPVITDFFLRNNERVNSNMVIMGKSGSGKSYATKTILSHLAAENCKIFILDPENEYDVLSQNLGGKLIDVGMASHGRINPFHIITTLDADEDTDNSVNSFSVHLQFLEQFFREILPGIAPRALETLNNLIVDLYKEKGITSHSNFSELKTSDYPVFDDLYALITDKLESAKIDYDIENYRELKNYISKFAGEGRNANLWNGESTLSVKENFAVFNFQSLLANKNGVIANAQMLLVLKWLDNEIIKNRDFNLKHKTNRKIIVAIDEAHVFIDPKYPIALDFMYQLAKRIRKYNGMQIIITQNIKDFVGTEGIIRKSTAIINACQYSFIFALSPNDMDDLCTLYAKAGQINETEQDQIINNPRGNAFIITSPSSRTNLEIVASQKISSLFE